MTRSDKILIGLVAISAALIMGGLLYGMIHAEPVKIILIQK